LGGERPLSACKGVGGVAGGGRQEGGYFEVPEGARPPRPSRVGMGNEEVMRAVIKENKGGGPGIEGCWGA